MKTNSKTTSIIQMQKDQLQQLCTQVRECVATNADLQKMKQQFGVADLWNIQKSTRYRIQRRNMI